MFRLKMINKPKLFKLRFNFIFPQIVLANMQEKEVTPTEETQIIEPDRNYDGLKKVTVKKIPDDYLIPSGEIDITQNGIYDIKDKESANVNVPEKQLGTKTITKNGIYKAEDDNLDGYSEVDVETSGVDINDYFKGTIEKGTNNTIQFAGWIKSFLKFRSPLEIIGNDASYMFSNYPLENFPQIDTSNITNMKYMFYDCKYMLESPLLNTSNTTNMLQMFSGCNKLIKIKSLNTINTKNMNNIFRNCLKLTTVPLLKANSIIDIYQAFLFCGELTTIGGLENLGQSYSTTQSTNYSSYQLNFASCSKLTHESLMNIINNLYDIKTKGCNAQQLVLGSTNIAKLTSEEIAVATEKGWTVS